MTARTLRESLLRGVGGVSGGDLRAGLVLGLVSVPDGLASGLLAGLNPLAGLYGYLFGTLAGALVTSSVVMAVQGTGAMAVILSDIPGLSGAEGASALVTLGILTGLLMLGAGMAGLGTLVRYVPNAVLTGFVNAVAVNIVLGQLAGVTGYASDASNRLVRALDTVLHVLSFHWPTVVAATVTVGLIILLERTRLGSLGLVVAIVMVSAAVAAVPGAGIQILADLASLPRGLPVPALPRLDAVVTMLVPAASLAFVGLVQGAAVSQSVPNPDGTYPDASRDFAGQGIANLVAAVFRGMPVGGSMSATSLAVAAGARGRAANVTAAGVMAVTILVFGEAAGFIAMPALAALLMVIGVRTFKLDQALMVWRTGTTQAVVMSVTFVLTLLVPMQYAVLVGVGISVILFVARQSNRVTVVRWVPAEGSGLPVETVPPRELGAGEIVVLTPYGSLFFASAGVFEGQLPVATASSFGAVVVLRLRGKEDLGSTFLRTMVRYHDGLRDAGAHLVLTGVGDRVLNQLRSTSTLEHLGEANVLAATPTVGESLLAGLARARALQADPSSRAEGPTGE